MSFPSGLDIARGTATGCRSINKFGRNTAVGATFVPVSIGGIYRTPQASGATALRIKSGGNANDTAAGSGARSVTLIGLNQNGEEVSETLATAGASASQPTQTSFIRLFRAFVSASGSYATQSLPSHSASIVIENSAGTQDWATIKDTDIGRAQTQIAVYSVPKHRQAFVRSVKISSDADKKANLVLFQRQGILQSAPPYEAMRLVEEHPQVSGLHQIDYEMPLGPFPELTDIGFLARSTSTEIDMSVSFEIVELIPS